MSPSEQRTIEPDELQGSTTAPSDLDRIQRDGRVVVTKTARGRGRTALRREAEILDRLRLSGMVEMIEVVDGDDTTTLVMEDAGRQTFADPIGLSGEELVRALRRCCTAAHELHLAGWTHGAIQPDHVVLGPRGRARLCSFGAAEPTDRGDVAAVDADVHQLVALAAHVATLEPFDRSMRARLDQRRRSRRLRRLAVDARTTLRNGSASLSARDLADAVSEIDAPRRLRTASPLQRSRRWAPGTAAVVAAVAVAALVWTVVADIGGSTGRSPEERGAAHGVAAPGSTGPTTSMPTATAQLTSPGAPVRCAGWPSVGVDIDGDGCPETVEVAGNIVTVDGTRYRMGAVGDVAAVGDWDCDGRATARLLRPTTGELFEFPTWASTGVSSDAYLLTALASATGIRSMPTDVGDRPPVETSGPADERRAASCDRMLVTLQDGTEYEPIPLTTRDTP